MTREETAARLRDTGMEASAEAIAALCEECIRFSTDAVDEDRIPVGASKLGGRPDLPPVVRWPEYNGSPMSFLGQINLEDLSELASAGSLPSSGRIYFFYDVEEMTWGYDPDDKDTWRVLYWNGPREDLARRPFPEDLERDYTFFPCSLEFREELSLPPYNSLQIEDLGLSDDDVDKYVDYLDSFYDEELTEHVPVHQILGHPDPIQNEMQLECQLASNGLNVGSPSGYEDPRVEELSPGARDWMLLLQLDTDDNPSWMWGDMGRLYFWIRRQDLRERAFDKAWMILQCS